MRILVTGATAKIGRMVVGELLARGATDIRALTVDPARAALPSPVEVVHGHFGRRGTVATALAGVDRMYLAPHLPTAAEVCAMAAAAGVRHIVDLAGVKGGEWQPIEDAVEASGAAWTHLEPGEFISNATIWAPQIRAGDEVRDAYPDVANAPVAEEDIAAVAAAVLLSDDHAGASLPLTGPAALSRREKVAELGAGLGRDLRYVELTGEAARARFTESMGPYGDWYLANLASMAAHPPQQVVSTVGDLLGRPATGYREWAAAHADLFR
ncbi:NAD(P)H-binding protein [Actinoplanes sp. NPDC051851]|uniref:NAD(P)H-binding protein n=1 Tax=Actinoplanes sp. NPDC051851 TaxID=3154753 RepID=UPI00341B8D68